MAQVKIMRNDSLNGVNSMYSMAALNSVKSREGQRDV